MDTRQQHPGSAYDFDTLIRRTGQEAAKWHELEKDPVSLADPLHFPFSVADMDFAVAPEIRDALHQAIENHLFGYQGLTDSYRQALAGWLQRVHQWQISPDWIIQTPGVVFSLYPIIAAFSEPGDGVIIQTPVYQPFNDAIERQQRNIIYNPLLENAGYYTMDLDDLERKAADPRNRILLFCSPHNPVGRVWSRRELADLAVICQKYQLLVISDEIHHDLVFPPHQHQVLPAVCPQLAARTIVCTSPGKTFNLAGLDLANLVIPDADLREQTIRSIRQFGIGRANNLATIACEAAYGQTESWYRALLSYLQENRSLITDFLHNQLPQLIYREPEGTYLAWLDLRPLQLNPRQQRLMLQKEARLFTSPGSWFGIEGQGFERLNFALPRQALMAGLQRLAAAISRHTLP